MTAFLTNIVVNDTIDTPSFKYLLATLDECIKLHSTGYTKESSVNYFRPLSELRNEIEYVISLPYNQEKGLASYKKETS